VHFDNELIAKLKKKDLKAFEQLHVLCAGQMRYLCMRYLRNETELDDVVQEGFLLVFKKIKQYSGSGSFEGWLKKIFINKTLEYLRKNKHTQKKLALDHLSEKHYIEQLYYSKQNEPEEIDMNEINKDTIDWGLIEKAKLTEEEMLKAMDVLPENFRIVCNMFLIDKLKHEDIAEQLDIPLATSKTRLLRAKRILQKELYRIAVEKIGR
jgi:RNA polymerase sigma-70 factor (ECF subfamily)